MTADLKREMRTWLFYFTIAFIAEIGAFIYLVEPCKDCQLNLYEIWLNFEAPRIRTWFLIFLTLSTFKFVVPSFIQQFRKGNR